MPNIIQLPDEVINQIAAGEVIERPASVIKELVENSIDAGAAKIEIEIRGGGKSFIKITDDGCGMNAEEVKLAIKRHATSKLNNIDDLFKIKTLGFRGEALPSIASISKMTIESKSKDKPSEPAVKIKISAEEIKSTNIAAFPPGTAITIEDLFFNVPVRKKFLKRDLTELAHISTVIQRFIVAYPEISFSFKNEGREIIFTPGYQEESLKNAIVHVFGKQIGKNLLTVNFKSGLLKIGGYVCSPQETRSDRNGQLVFINRRYVANPLIYKAFSEAFKSLIPVQRHPLGFIHIEIDPAFVDVNVHPTKKEVRFTNSSEIFSSFKAALNTALENINQESFIAKRNESKLFGIVKSSDSKNYPEKNQVLDISFFSNNGKLKAESKVDNNVSLAYPQAVTQIYKTYIVAKQQGHLILIDQHAAQERIIYDSLRERQENKKVVSQTMLIPEIIELTSDEIIIFSDIKTYLFSLGFEIAEAGERQYRVLSVPVEIKNSVKEIIKELINESSISKRKNISQWQDEVLKIISCRSAIKAGDRLEIVEMDNLIKQLFNTKYPYTCPHGRPTIIEFSKEDLEKLFKRK